MEWTDDFKFDAASKEITLDDQHLRTLVLIDLQKRLQSRERNLSSFRLPEPTQNELDSVDFTDQISIDALIQEEMNFDTFELTKLVDERRSQFTNSQRSVFDTVLEAIEARASLCLFIDAI